LIRDKHPAFATLLLTVLFRVYNISAFLFNQRGRNKNCGSQALYFTGSTDFFFFFLAGDVELAPTTGSTEAETGLSCTGVAEEEGGWLLVNSLASLTSIASCTRTE
jgi:hypothetical protein